MGEGFRACLPPAFLLRFLESQQTTEQGNNDGKPGNLLDEVFTPVVICRARLRVRGVFSQSNQNCCALPCPSLICTVPLDLVHSGGLGGMGNLASML